MATHFGLQLEMFVHRDTRPKENCRRGSTETPFGLPFQDYPGRDSSKKRFQLRHITFSMSSVVYPRVAMTSATFW